MLKYLRFAELKNALQRLGFEATTIPGSHVTFNNPQADAVIVLSNRIASNGVGVAHIRMVEKILEEKGIISREDFERSISAH